MKRRVITFLGCFLLFAMVFMAGNGKAQAADHNITIIGQGVDTFFVEVGDTLTVTNFQFGDGWYLVSDLQLFGSNDKEILTKIAENVLQAVDTGYTCVMYNVTLYQYNSSWGGYEVAYESHDWCNVYVAPKQSSDDGSEDGDGDSGDGNEEPENPDVDEEPELYDVTAVRLDTEAIAEYVDNSPYIYWYEVEKEIKLTGTGKNIFDEYTQEFSYQCTNKNINVDAELYNNTIYLNLSGGGKGNINFVINGKTFTVSVSLTKVKLQTTSLLLATKTTKQLNVTNVKTGIKWKSTNSKVATVSPKGLIRAKNTGNTVITATIGNIKLGCVVSVVPEKIKNVVNRAIHIGKTCKYSQAKRMSDGYYDCSSLVWKAYSKYGTTFDSKYWAPTSQNEAKWCRNKKRVLTGGFRYKKIQNMTFLPGDLVFKSKSATEKYSTVYHVEMIAGYEFYGFNSEGTPILELKWANRATGYGAEEGAIVGRPYCKMP